MSPSDERRKVNTGQKLKEHLGDFSAAGEGVGIGVCVCVYMPVYMCVLLSRSFYLLRTLGPLGTRAV